MKVFDANILLYALYQDAFPEYEKAHHWLEQFIKSQEHFAIPAVVEMTVARIATNPKIFKKPLGFRKIGDYFSQFKKALGYITMMETAELWELYYKHNKDHASSPSDVVDSYLAVIAIKSGSELVSNYDGFKRFKNLKYLNPLL